MHFQLHPRKRTGQWKAIIFDRRCISKWVFFYFVSFRWCMSLSFQKNRCCGMFRSYIHKLLDFFYHFHSMFPLHPRKLTCPPKRDYFNRKYIFQPLVFRGHVSFSGSRKNTFPLIGRLWDLSLPGGDTKVSQHQ